MIGSELSASLKGDTVTFTLLLGAAGLAFLVKGYTTTPYDTIFDLAGREHGVNPNLLRAIGRKESNFRPQAVGAANSNGTRDYGVMQINERTAETLGITKTALLNAEQNIRAGARLLNLMKAELGPKYTYTNLISAYNAGTPTVKARGIINPGYVGEVELHHKLYELGRIFA